MPFKIIKESAAFGLLGVYSKHIKSKDMYKINLTVLFKKHVSLTEWYESMGHKDTTALRMDSNIK